MFNYTNEQKVVSLGKIKTGGQPGKYPPVMFGTIFFGKKYRDISSNPQLQKKTEEILNKMFSHGDSLGLQLIVDVFIPDESEIIPRVNFISDYLDNQFFSVDIPESQVRIRTLEYLSEIGLLNRVIYNSINLGITEREITSLKDNTPEAAIVLGYNPKDMSTDGRIDILDNGAGFTEKGLIDLAADVGIKSLLLDTGATPFNHYAGETLRAIPVFKSKWGLPTGCAIHNTIDSWLWLKKYRKSHPEVYTVCDASAHTMAVTIGADFLLYGKIENSKTIFPAVALAAMFVAEGAKDYFGVKIHDFHPWRRLI